jgi:hypothetical protein
MRRRTFLKILGVSVSGFGPDVMRGLAVDTGHDSELSNPNDSVGEDGLFLFATASDGTIDQWDGRKTPAGILLRWIERDGLGFPDFGYDVYRASLPNNPNIVPFDAALATALRQRQPYSYRGELTISSSSSITSVPTAGQYALQLTKESNSIHIDFSGSAWYVRVTAASASVSAPLGATLYGGGAFKKHVFSTQVEAIEWSTLGGYQLQVYGSGTLIGLQYRLVGAAGEWRHLYHLTLPVAYGVQPCNPGDQPPKCTGPDAQEAKGRLSAVSGAWEARYCRVFCDMYPTLRALATGEPQPKPSDGEPDDSVVQIAPADAVRIAALDPHVARMLGLAWDDAVPLDGQLYAYKVIGRWKCETTTVRASSLRPEALAGEHGILLEWAAGALTFVQDRLVIRLTKGQGVRFNFPRKICQATLCIPENPNIGWNARDENGNLIATGSLRTSPDFTKIWRIIPVHRDDIVITAPGMRRFDIVGPGEFTITALAWETTPFIERTAILPGIAARPNPAPATPSGLMALVRQSSGAAVPNEAALDWDLPVSTGGEHLPDSAVFYQIGAAQISTTPDTSQPSPPQFNPRAHLPNPPEPILVPAEVGAVPRPRVLNVYAGLTEGWWCWWVRGMDIFGRVSAPSAPFVAKVEDIASPPAPMKVFGEYAQANLPGGNPLVALSTFSHAWLKTHNDTSGIFVVWEWTPELEARCPDVDGFRLYIRRPVLNSNTSNDSAVSTYEGAPWGSPIAHLGPTAIRYSGHTTLTAPRPGGTIEVNTDIAVPADTDPFQVRTGGVLTWSSQRLPVVDRSGNKFICKGGATEGPPPGTAVSWYPGYAFVVADSNFGPQPNAAQPVAHAQVTVRSVRRWGNRERESVPALPVLITAIDPTPPDTPAIRPIATGDYCAELATPPDWYGVSRFTLDWTPTAGMTYMVYRALAEQVMQLDLAACGGSAANHITQIPEDHWPADIKSGSETRKQTIRDDLINLDNQLKTAFGLPGSDPARAEQVEKAYASLHVDAQRVIASQECVLRAYVPRNATPLKPSEVPFVDEFNGNARAHYSYRVASRTPAGLIGTWTDPTPPICCPYRVPPSPPNLQAALADELKVRLRWIASPEPDVVSYRIYRAASEQDAADLRTMEARELVAASPTATPNNGEQLPSVVLDADNKPKPGWLEFVAEATISTQNWFFRVVALNSQGNNSWPSVALVGRSLSPLPAPPTLDAPLWNPSHTEVTLTWTSRDMRLACLVERRRMSKTEWSCASGWLARGQYRFIDTPPMPTERYEYRVRLRDMSGQVNRMFTSVLTP